MTTFLNIHNSRAASSWSGTLGPLPGQRRRRTRQTARPGSIFTNMPALFGTSQVSPIAEVPMFAMHFRGSASSKAKNFKLILIDATLFSTLLAIIKTDELFYHRFTLQRRLKR